MYDPSSGEQLHDLNPGIASDGLFWTVPVPDNAVQVNPGNGSASLQMTDVGIDDYGNIGNALFGGGPEPIPGSVSFSVQWRGVNQRLNIKNTDPPSAGGGFAGQFVRNTAKMQWAATVGTTRYVSDPLATSFSAFAEIGQERSGVFLT
jgi:hypothetical protein